MADTGDITVVVHDEDADASQLDELTRGLHEELLLLDLPEVTRAGAAGVPGGKSGLVTALTTLVVSGGFSAAALRSLTLVVRDWIRRGGQRRAVLVSGEHRLELDAASRRTQEAAVQAWIEALAQQPAGGAAAPAATAPALEGITEEA
ncbi:hypothetical protein ACFV3R_21700 [Streptomyces sp. NPDC059740]|uniref:hypothetical protein n=1 Tax=Streptomyces sp. NPDC059740 TaxID=3346926 RepID=UPI003668D61F